jgi:hypothetical protein
MTLKITSTQTPSAPPALAIKRATVVKELPPKRANPQKQVI